MPMLRLQTRAVVDADIDIMRRWLAGDYQALVVVTSYRRAVRFGRLASADADEQQVQPIEPITAKTLTMSRQAPSLLLVTPPLRFYSGDSSRLQPLLK